MSKPEVTFVNTLTVHGFLNGIVNLTFTTARWCARQQGEQVVIVPDEYESLFLRMDLNTAISVRDALNKHISEQSKPGTVN